MESRFICDHDSLTERYGKFILKPLERGAGVIIGNSLRRVLLSQLDGAAVVAVKIKGVPHEFAPIPGAVEDTSEVIRNLRRLELKMPDSKRRTLRVSTEGKGVITARDLKTDDGVVILNPDIHIVTLEAGAKFAADIEVDTGIGFRQAEEGDGEIGVIAVDADFSPIETVSYAVKELGGEEESLYMEVVTNGSIDSVDAVKKAAEILRSGLTDKRLISSEFDETNGKFVMDAKPGGHTIGSALSWSLMSYSSQQKADSSYEPVRFADYTVQENGNLVLEVQTDGSLGPKEAVSLAGKRVSGMMEALLSPPIRKRGHPSFARESLKPATTGRVYSGSVSFGDASSFWLAPDLLDIQRESYERFLQKDVQPQDRKCCGLEKTLAEAFPVKNGGLVLDCVGYSCGEPSRNPIECIDLQLTYSLPVMLKMRLTIGETKRIVEEEVSIGEIPLMTDDGIFIINGLKRVILGQLAGIEYSDFNDLSKKRARTVGDFLYEEISGVFEGIRTIASERMAVEDSEKLQPSSLLDTADAAVATALNRFFASNRFSQVLQDTNSLDRLTHCRRFRQDTAQGISPEESPPEQRGLHNTTYGRLCAPETPEGPSVGLIGTLAIYASVDEEGTIKAPYRKFENGKVSDEIVYLSAQEESDLTISPAPIPIKADTVPARIGSDVKRVASGEVDYVDAFRQQISGPSSSLIPLIEHDDCNRALMGCNMQRQAVPPLFAEQPLIQSGSESKIALDSREVAVAKRDGIVKRVTSERIEIAADGGTDVYDLLKHRPSLNSTWINQKPIVSSGQKVTKGQVIADGASEKDGVLSLGRNIKVAYMPWEGYNFEDAILVSEKLIKEDVLTSLHIKTYQTEIRDTRHGREMLTKQPPGVEESKLTNLDIDGIVKIGAWVTEGDVLVGKMAPKSAEISPEDKLLQVLAESDSDYENASLVMSPGTYGRVTKVWRLSRAKGHSLPKGVDEMVKVEVTTKRRAMVGDKLTGRHGNKGTISRILPEEDMPFMPDGTPVEMALNPLGVPSRMNLGQILETHLGWAAKELGVKVISPPYDGPDRSQIKELLGKAGLPTSGMTKIYDGRNGKAVDTDVTVGYQYMMKLIHMVDDKIHARSTGPYSLFTQQPTGGRAHFGGQRFGEMETWALEAYGAAHALRELLTVKSDDVVGRRKMYENLLKGSDSTPTPLMPETFRKLILCLKGLAFDVRALDENGEDVVSNVDDIAAVTMALASPDKIRDEWSHGAVHIESSSWENHQPIQGGLFCERIFGSIKEWQCQCGKLSGKKHKGEICDKCGVEVGSAGMRNERMGHIDLSVPVCHTWFLSARPNPIAVLLGIEPDDVKKIVYYDSYIVMDEGHTDLQYKQMLSKEEYEAKKKEYGEKAFQVETGAAAIRELLNRVDLSELSEQLDDPQKKRVVQAFLKSGIKPQWTIMDCLPVIPPGMRPTRHLEGGSFATSDLNELYARVISRNGKYRELASIGGQEAHDTARTIQEAVDSLFGNGRRSKGETGPLRSLSDLLKGKGGMFRGNLLGKRVDYSGRSVIVVGPELKLDECGLPESMALELFKPFIVHKLLSSGSAHSISSARKMVESRSTEAREAVSKIAEERVVMLNRAPTLHRVGVQAFKPVIMDVSAIRLHPLVCMAFNADFDGDQMAVHIPLSAEAQEESRQLMLSHKNVLSATHGGAIVHPAQEMITGCYYMTMDSRKKGKSKTRFTDVLEVKKAYELGRIGLHDSIQFHIDGKKLDTTVGRILFNEIVPEALGRFINQQMDKRSLTELVEECHANLGEDETAKFLNDLDDLGFKYATRFGSSIGMDTLKTVPERDQLLKEAETLDDQVRERITKGEISQEEAAEQRLQIWDETASKLKDAAMKSTGPGSDSINPVILMVASGARGNPRQLKNLTGLVGMVAKPTRDLYDVPITSNLMEGLSMLEYFMITAGARAGIIDVVCRVGRAGSITRKIISASQDVIIIEEDCGTEDGIAITALTSGEEILLGLPARISGRVAAQDVKHPETGKAMVAAGEVIDEETAGKIQAAGVQEVKVRSPLTCETSHGLCARCYGVDLSTGTIAKLGAPVGMIAGTAIGEPATQLTFRIVVKSKTDYITAGLPRLESLLDARLDARETAQISVDGSYMPMRDALSRKGDEAFRILMLDELMKLYSNYDLNVNDKHFEILISCMLSRVRIIQPGDTGFYAGEVVNKSQLRLENQKIKAKSKRASAEPVLVSTREAALSTDSFLAAAAFGDTVNVLAQAAIRGSRDELRGIRENLIVGKLIPAGTGFRKAD